MPPKVCAPWPRSDRRDLRGRPYLSASRTCTAASLRVPEETDGKYVVIGSKAGAPTHPGWYVGHILAFNARAGRPNAMEDLVAVGIPERWRNGPLLDEVEYPQVLVARAVSDGRAIDAVFFRVTDRGR